MNDCEYSATKIMGWGIIGLYYTDSNGKRMVRRYGKGNSWHPGTDRNQLWLVLTEWVAWFELLPQRWAEREHERKTVARVMKETLGIYYGANASHTELYAAAMKCPALALEAICKAHQAQETK